MDGEDGNGVTGTNPGGEGLMIISPQQQAIPLILFPTQRPDSKD